MSKPAKCSEHTSEEAFEIIELATNDLEVLARAFDVISEVCNELNNPSIQFDKAEAKLDIN
jgi:hypothetical protein